MTLLSYGHSLGHFYFTHTSPVRVVSVYPHVQLRYVFDFDVSYPHIELSLFLYILVPKTPNLLILNSARSHRVFQNFVVPLILHIYQKLILPADAS